MSSIVPPLDHTKVNGELPCGVKSILPLLKPLQVTLLVVVESTDGNLTVQDDNIS